MFCSTFIIGESVIFTFVKFWAHCRRFIFLSLGLWRVFRPEQESRIGTDTLLEPDGSKVCRRKIISLSSIFVITGLVGADLRNLNVFGVMPDGVRGTTVIGVIVFLTQLYWYFLRYCHLEEDGVIEQEPLSSIETKKHLRIKSNHSFVLVQKKVNLISNWLSFLLMVASWYFIVSWIMVSSAD